MKRKPARQYTKLHEIMASPTKPLDKAKRDYQVNSMWRGFAAIESGQAPTTEDWRLCSDAVNILETLTTDGNVYNNAGKAIPGWWQGCDGEPVQVTDASGLLMDAITALAMAGRRHKSAGVVRMDGKGLQAVRAVLEDYAEVIEALPARAVICAHRLTERRIHEILAGRKASHDVEVVSI